MLQKLTNFIVVTVILLRFTTAKFVFRSLDHLRLSSVNDVITENGKKSEKVIKTKQDDIINSDSPFVYWPADKNVKSRTKFQNKSPNNDLINLDPDRILYTADSLGNPFTAPDRCVRIASDLTYLCDPDNILSQQEQLQLNTKLKQFPTKNFHYCPDSRQYGLKVGMLLVNNILVPFPKSLDDAAQLLCQELIDKWGLGNKDCNDGIMVLYIKNNNAIFIATKDANDTLLSTDKITNIEEIFTNNLNTNNNDYRSLSDLVDNLSDALPKKTEGTKWSVIIPCAIVILYLVGVGAMYKIS
ncbi:BmGPI11, Conserved protein, unknown function [Babesia microti strain RI]|uniref:TPM domain-containing protein n=1 Tax=Babesia microti (strain RI) TaxID=1133968 RepID=A0A1R4ABA8_BABMR|nr:BmGPI11, Conserved protein, unknown function [Babesia microti strain RI]SJK86276.1 BmGPI11, Conserved protein, unknown function [Babesia microti strain RI]|eukprot:XP_021338453.1 BmGPI11, Conserved protein, unknown function [Babesia microti strain RI]